MDKSEVIAFIKSCLDELGINYDTCDDCINITFENDDLFPINVSIFPNENIISSFAEIDDMEIPSNRRSVVLEYINNYSCKGIEDDGNFNAYVFIYTDDETGKDFIHAYSSTPMWETMGSDQFSAFTLSTVRALNAVMRDIFRLTL